MVNDLLTTYKYGWKTSYYQNTYDQKKDVGEEQESKDTIAQLINQLNDTEEDDCESCKI